MKINIKDEDENIISITPVDYRNRQAILELLKEHNLPRYVLQSGEIMMNRKYKALLRLYNV